MCSHQETASMRGGVTEHCTCAGLPGLALGSKHVLDCRPDRIALNCNSTRVSIIDISGILTLYDLTAKRLDPETGHTTSGARIAGFERKDVWDFRWAEDNPLLFAMMERTYMYIFRDTDPEEPFFNNGWIWSVRAMC